MLCDHIQIDIGVEIIVFDKAADILSPLYIRRVLALFRQFFAGGQIGLPCL